MCRNMASVVNGGYCSPCKGNRVMTSLQNIMDRDYVFFCILDSQVDLPLHGLITLSDAMSYDKPNFFDGKLTSYLSCLKC